MHPITLILYSPSNGLFQTTNISLIIKTSNTHPLIDSPSWWGECLPTAVSDPPLVTPSLPRPTLDLRRIWIPRRFQKKSFGLKLLHKMARLYEYIIIFIYIIHYGIFVTIYIHKSISYNSYIIRILHIQIFICITYRILHYSPTSTTLALERLCGNVRKTSRWSPKPNWRLWSPPRIQMERTVSTSLVSFTKPCLFNVYIINYHH